MISGTTVGTTQNISWLVRVERASDAPLAPFAHGCGAEQTKADTSLQALSPTGVIDYSLNAWDALTLHLDDGAVAIDNNLIERQIKPWKLGAKN